MKAEVDGVILPVVSQELELLESIISIINDFADRAETAAVSRTLTEIINGNTGLIDRLRTQIRTIYLNEYAHGRHYSPRFYDALFSLQILLTKYHPVTTNVKEADGRLQCPVTMEAIDHGQELFTSQGSWFSHDGLRPVIKSNGPHPIDRSTFAGRERNYLKNILEAKENSQELSLIPVIPEASEQKDAIDQPAAPRIERSNENEDYSCSFWCCFAGSISGMVFAMIVIYQTDLVPDKIEHPIARRLDIALLVGGFVAGTPCVLLCLKELAVSLLRHYGCIVDGFAAPIIQEIDRLPAGEEKPVISPAACAVLLACLQAPVTPAAVAEEKVAVAEEPEQEMKPVVAEPASAEVAISVLEERTSVATALGLLSRARAALFGRSDEARQPLLPNDAFLARVENQARAAQQSR